VNALLRRDFHEDRAFATGSHSSGMRPRSANCFFTARGWHRFIDLVDSHDDRHVGGPGVVNGFQGLGITPSSAATTMTTISVTLAPRLSCA